MASSTSFLNSCTYRYYYLAGLLLTTEHIVRSVDLLHTHIQHTYLVVEFAQLFSKVEHIVELFEPTACGLVLICFLFILESGWFGESGQIPIEFALLIC